jgi:hypothetical protein
MTNATRQQKVPQLNPDLRPDQTLDLIDALDQSAYTDALFAKCLPKGACELDVFEAYAAAAFHAKQVRIAETHILRELLANPTSRESMRQAADIQHLGQCYDRRARQSFESLCKLQRDRLVAQSISEELASHKVVPPPIPASMPIAQIQKSVMHVTKPIYTGILLYGDHLSNSPAAEQILRDHPEYRQ